MKTLITIVIIAGLAAVAGAIFVGVKSFDGVVTEHPYEKGLLWDETERKKEELGWRIEFQDGQFITGENDVLISVLDDNDMPVTLTEVALRISRPAITKFDRYFDIIQVKDGVYSARMNFPLFGYWNVGMNVSNEEDTLFLERKVYVHRKEGTS